MALKITKASEPIQVETLTLAVYAPPGVGKTSMGFTATSPLLLDFDQGMHRSRNRRDGVRVSAWGDVENISADDLAEYQTVVIDTAGKALDSLTQDIIAKNPKLGRGGALTLQGYGELKSRFVAWMKMVRSIGKDVVLIVHMDEQKSGDEMIERLDMVGASKNEVYKSADAMGRIQMLPGRKFGMLNFNPSDTAFGKNPGQLDALPIPDYAHNPDFLGEIIQSIKDALNEMTEAQREEVERLATLRQELAEMDGADAFNAKIGEMANADPKDKGLLVAAAQDKGLEFDKAEKVFREKEAA